MKTFITFLLISVLFAISTYAMADASASTHSYFEQVRANSFPDTTNKHQLLDQVKKRGYVRIIVKYNMEYTQEGKLGNDAQKNAQRQSISQMHDTFLEDIKELNASTVKRMKLSPLLALTVDEEALKYLYRSPLIERIYIDRASKAFLSKSISIVKADDTWEGFTITGSSTKIVIIDSGVDAGHEMLSGKVIDGACFNTNDQNLNISTLCPNAAESDYGVAAGEDCGSTTGCDHGTHVAGIAAGNSVSYYNDSYSGVAKEAKIISIQVFSKYGNDLDCEDTDGDGVGDAPCIASQLSDQISALEWIYTQYGNDNSVAAVNMSLGDGEYTSVCDTDPRKDAIDNLSINGIITIAASGNENNSNALSAPACISSVISVGATNDQDTHWSESGNEGSNAASFLDLVAPGVSIISSVPGNNQYASLTGTSMAAPHVAGTIALMNEAYPYQITSSYRTILQNTAEDVSAMNPYSFTDEYGHGRLNTFEAVTQSLINNPSVYVYDYSHTLSPGEEFLDETIIILDGNSLTVNVDLSLTNTTLYIHGTLEGSGTIYLYGNSEIVERLGGENNFQGNVVTSDAYPIIVRNNFGGYQGGQVGVGKNVSPVNRTSPHQELVSNGDTLNLEAYDNQNYDGHTWVFNNTEGTEDKSQWFIEQGSSINPINDSFDQSPSIEVDENEGAEIFNEQKRIFTISRNDYSPEADNTFNTANVQVVEGNTLTAPPTQTNNGVSYVFYEWSDGVTDNSRTINSPISLLTAHYKGSQLSNTVGFNGSPGQRKIVRTDNGWLHHTYESLGRVWYEAKPPGGDWEFIYKWSSIYVDDDGGSAPSIAAASDASTPAYPNSVILAWQQGTDIKMRIYYYISSMGTYSNWYDYTLLDAVSSPSLQAQPNVVFSGQNQFIVLWETATGISFTLLKIDSSGFVEIASDSIPGTDGNSGQVAASSDINYYFPYFDVVWSQSGSNGASSIKFQQISESSGSVVYSKSSPVTISSSYMFLNANPSVITVNNEAVFSWMCRGTSSWDPMSQSACLRSYDYVNLGPFTQYDVSVSDASLARVGSNDYYVAWSQYFYYPESQYNNDLNRYAKSTSLSNKQTLNTDFRDIQLYDAPVGQDMRLSVFQHAGLPKYFDLSRPLDTSPLKAVPEAAGQSARGLIVSAADKDGIYLEIGGFELDGRPVSFIQVPSLPTSDSRSIEQLRQLPSAPKPYRLGDVQPYLLSEPFLVTEESDLVVGSHWNAPDSVLTDLLGATGTFNFAIDLVTEDGTRSVGELHQSTLSAGNSRSQSENHLSFHGTLPTVTENKVRLRLSVDTNVKDLSYTLVNSYYDEDDQTRKQARDIELSATEEITEFGLSQNYPNPFNPTTQISYQLPEDSVVRLEVYDLLGRRVQMLVNDNQQTGRHTVTFDASGLASGVYIYRLQAGEFTPIQKAVSHQIAGLRQSAMSLGDMADFLIKPVSDTVTGQDFFVVATEFRSTNCGIILKSK